MVDDPLYNLICVALQGLLHYADKYLVLPHQTKEDPCQIVPLHALCSFNIDIDLGANIKYHVVDDDGHDDDDGNGDYDNEDIYCLPLDAPQHAWYGAGVDRGVKPVLCFLPQAEAQVNPPFQITPQAWVKCLNGHKSLELLF